MSLATWGGGGIDELPEAASFWITVDGGCFGYVPGALDFVNAAFLGTFEGGEIPCGTTILMAR